ncbi:MAG: response regulator transcription factor [Elusimicrobiota bacterium]
MNDKKTILLVDDDKKVVKAISTILSEHNYSIVPAYDGLEALEKAKKINPDIILLDIIMPELKGWEVCKKIRENKNTSKIPVIMLTGQNSSENEIHGLQCGADDYIIKPYDSRILIARIKTILRRYDSETERIIKTEDIYINVDTHTVKIKNKPINLWPKEFDLLHFLVKRKGRVFTREVLIDCVWGYEYCGTTRTVDTTIKRLRKKLGPVAEKIKTIQGLGYKFED